MKSTNKIFKIFLKHEIFIDILISIIMLTFMVFLFKFFPDDDFLGKTVMLYNVVEAMSIILIVIDEMLDDEKIKIFCFQRKAYLNSKFMCLAFRALFISIVIILILTFINTGSKISIGEGTEKYFSSSFQFIILMITFIISMGLIGMLDLVSRNTFSFKNKSSQNVFFLMSAYVGYMSLFYILLLIFLENKWLIILLISWIINILLIKTIVKRYKNKSEI